MFVACTTRRDYTQNWELLRLELRFGRVRRGGVTLRASAMKGMHSVTLRERQKILIGPEIELIPHHNRNTSILSVTCKDLKHAYFTAKSPSSAYARILELKDGH